jgi:hypothetical protein
MPIDGMHFQLAFGLLSIGGVKLLLTHLPLSSNHNFYPVTLPFIANRFAC